MTVFMLMYHVHAGVFQVALARSNWNLDRASNAVLSALQVS